MRPLVLLLLGAGAAFCQPVSFGVKLGVPLTDFIDAVKTSGNPNSFLNYATHTNRFIVGVGGEIKLPLHLGIELDALYRHVNYTSTQQTVAGVTTTVINADTRAHAFEFPLLLKYRFGGKFIRPYIAGGVAWDTLQGLRQDVRTSILNATGSTNTSTTTPPQLRNKTSRGFVSGAGLDIKILLIHIKPEIRYTRWGAEHFFDSSLLHTNKNQGEFILGIQF